MTGPISFISCHTIRSSRFKQTRQTRADMIYMAMTTNNYLIKVSSGGNKETENCHKNRNQVSGMAHCKSLFSRYKLTSRQL